ncbi:MAG TPA: hypothetical protein VGC21_21540 [Telluria sp.]|jgi:hypothetical protein
MSFTAFASITTALKDLLAAEPPVSPQIFRARDRQLAEQFETAVNIQFDGSMPVNSGFSDSPVDWESRFTIECYARTAGSADLAVDPLLSEVFKRIALDTTLGGLVMDIGYPLIEAEYTSEQVKTGWIRMTYPVRHRTSNLTLEPQ